MKSSLLYCVLCMLAAAAELLEPELRYHEAVGIPTYEAIRQFEEGNRTVNPVPKIWGGQPLDAGAQPHLGALVITLTNGRRSFCGCSLLANTRSVTAAHCWETSTVTAQQFTVVFGSNRVMTGGVRINTDQVVLHPNYNMNNLNNDIAVIRHRNVPYTNHVINPIDLPTGPNEYLDILATAAGFGGIGDDPLSQSPDKRQANLLVIRNAVCRQTYLADFVPASVLCASTTHGSSTCGGDSGGPLAIGFGNNRILIGVTSFKDRNGCTRGSPVGFARVTSFVPWIREQL